jgi:hypothetical protein
VTETAEKPQPRPRALWIVGSSVTGPVKTTRLGLG